VILFLLVAPGALLLGPLAGLLLVARPVSRQAWAIMILALVWCALWLLRVGDLAHQVVRAYSVLLVGPWLALVQEQPGGRRPLQTAVLAIGIAVGLTFSWLVVLGFSWGEVEAAAARTLSTGFISQARVAQGLGGTFGQELSVRLYEAAGQSRFVAALLPSGLILSSLGGLALAWRGHFWLAAEPLGSPPPPFAAFTFSDQAVWLVVAALAALLWPGAEGVRGLETLATNVLVVMFSLYALRGAAIFRASTGRPSAVGVALYSVLAILMFAFVASGLMVLGLADTWLDFRRRLAAPTGGSG
jgi:hypothetical protein